MGVIFIISSLILALKSEMFKYREKVWEELNTDIYYRVDCIFIG